VTKEDQDKINCFSRLHNKERLLEEELQGKQVRKISLSCRNTFTASTVRTASAPQCRFRHAIIHVSTVQDRSFRVRGVRTDDNARPTLYRKTRKILKRFPQS
jgi:hypothetical protein